jgi:mono/diheme cytochrome c family protein
MNRPALIALATMFLAACTASVAEERIDYLRDIQPILSDACYHCHGPDGGHREADLRLDTKEGALGAKGKPGAIIPGNSADSELIRRILSDDADEKMPPPKSNRHLKPEQIAKLRKWIDAGATWDTPWAFKPPAKLTPPTVKDEKRIRHPVDRFVLAPLEAQGLGFRPDASRERWLRRVTLDLTGLPPTLAELDAFLADRSADAFEKVVDRLLASPRYGERMASEWLDLARFADTHGYQADRERAMWPYRDWVINAFHRNQRFDEFVTWQLAGDLLTNATREQRLATAFNRLHMQNEEGGIVEEEFRVAYVVDRVNTFGTAFLGLTLECSRCHDHKYDPITQRDFYSLFAFFQNIDESGQTSHFTNPMPVPALPLVTDEQQRHWEGLHRAIREAERKLAGHRQSREFADSFARWRDRKDGTVDLKAGLELEADFANLSSGTLINKADPKQPGRTVEGPKSTTGPAGPKDEALALDGEDGAVFPGVGHFTRTDPFTIRIRLKAKTLEPRAVVLHHSRAPIDAGSRGYELLLESGRVAFGMHHMWPGNSLKVVTTRSIKPDTWVEVTVTHDGSGRARGLRIFLDGVPVRLDVVRDDLQRDIAYEGGEPELALGNRFRDNGFKDGAVDDLAIYRRQLSRLEVEALHGGAIRPTADQDDRFGAPADRRVEHFALSVDAESKRLAEELRKARAAENEWSRHLPEIMVMREMPEPKPAFMLKRGNYDQPGDRVTANTPAFLPPFPKDQPRNRLGLARWLLDPEHPLMARVTVNRLWQQLFDKGIVESADNFGLQATPPTHPDLLDWLARDFVAGGWDVKRLLRGLVLSTAYRQDSDAPADLRQRDPYNQSLARAPIRRLSAEMLRDQSLFAAGLLVERQGGPSVRPYQPDGIWDLMMGGGRYVPSSGPDLYRRSLYTYWKRTAPHPAMTVFDAADRSNCAAKRQTTNTPLQALALLNDPQHVEAARFLAQRTLKEAGQGTPKGTGEAADAARIDFVFRTLTTRAAGPNEVRVLARLLADQRSLYARQPTEAEKLLAVGAGRTDPKLDRVELAAWTSLALALINHDDAVHRR